MEKIAYPIIEAAKAVDVSRSRIFEAARNQELTVHKAGRSTIVAHDDLVGWSNLYLRAEGRRRRILHVPPTLSTLHPKPKRLPRLSTDCEGNSSMIDYPSRPSAGNLQQRPVTVGAAAQHMILGILGALVWNSSMDPEIR